MAQAKRHNPVDSICRKIKTIQMMDQFSNPALQIPKFQSRNFDSPQNNARKNLEELLKKRTFKSYDGTPCSRSPNKNNIFSPYLQAISPSLRDVSDYYHGKAAYSLVKSKECNGKPQRQICHSDSCSPLVLPAREDNPGSRSSAASNSEYKDLTHEINYLTSSPNFHFLTTDQKTRDSVFLSPFSKKFSLDERGWRSSLENKANDTYNVSLICEEDLLTTIFYACDTERKGKVTVSTILDYMRHTTSRGSEDSGLEELCNMLDPDKRDISMDFETFHATMKEWIEDCRRKWEGDATKEITLSMEDSELKLHEIIPAAKKASVKLNITSGSLEAFGGDASKGDLETSDLIACVADLQFNNQKLQEENSKLKLVLESMEEANNRLMGDLEELHNQVKSAQQTVMRTNSLEEELEEMKSNLNSLEEKRDKLLSQNKRLEKENQSLILKISDLQEENLETSPDCTISVLGAAEWGGTRGQRGENTRNALDADGLQKKILELAKNASELQMKIHVYETTVVNKDASLLQKDLDIKDLKSAIVEYTSIIETLRAEKNKLVYSMQQMQQELISNGIHFQLICKYNRNLLEGTYSLHSELELAQSPEITRFEWTPLDESLDREVLLLLQGPEIMREEFKATIKKLQEEASETEELVVTSFQWVPDPEVNIKETWGRELVVLKQKLEERRKLWCQKLDLLKKCTESLDKKFIEMSGNLRRTRTQQFHLRKELASRQHELENVKQLQEAATGQVDTLSFQLQEARKWVEDSCEQAKDRDEALYSACEEAKSLKCELEEAISEQKNLQAMNTSLMSTCQMLQEKIKEQKTTVNTLREMLFERQLCGLLHQSFRDEESDQSALSTSNIKQETVKQKQHCCSQRQDQRLGVSFVPLSGHECGWYTPLLDALTLDTLQLNPRVHTNRDSTCTAARPLPAFEQQDLINGSILDMTPASLQWKIHFAGNQTEADLPVSTTMMDLLLTEESSTGPLTLVDPAISSEHSTPSRKEATASSLESTKISTELLTMETKSSEFAQAKEEDVPTFVAMKQNKDKDLTANLSGADLTREFCPSTEDHRTTAENALKLNVVCEEMEALKEGSGQASIAVPSIKENSPMAAGIKGAKTNLSDDGSPNEKEVEAEFLRLSLGFKCDLFTLDKRVRLEERSRDLAEENLKKEITNGLKLLELLAPLCDEDNQAQEIIKKLEKCLQSLSQYVTRVASRAEMLGAINQENRVSKAVEVMIQHVENLKRMYTKEHAELEELKQVLLQNERSFSSLGDGDESANKSLPSSLNYKPSSLRRVSIATLPKSTGNAGIGLSLTQLNETGGAEKSDKFNRRSSSWGRLGAKQNEKRPSLQRFISTYSWTEYEEEHSETKNTKLEPPVEETREDQQRKMSVAEKGKSPSKWILNSACNMMSSWVSHLKTSFCDANKTLWISVTILVLLAAFTSFLTGLSLQRPADAAPVGTGNSWTSLQKLLWPYTGLRHNGPPPT
ncbi:lymphoid-restricted membrane protein-like isoform X1 [Alligator sinensis]|uniref:Lymphoid-restricted membrane protein-like isoform X1 n=1 Tax=Alligator sinensis TaxID=38654 RepID=A0A1U7RQA0_ALLSI|nr:lymphoid-restricted membrane protein-like isoform X1 [Alligator sinensis]XP_006027402.1 lymphoid-restricted membrane protein-like isoform X1 [Alligator sinensis]XP_006027403.1 lymphoid-restricted membrane protein-like isoform X1 [Alligator sinensis]